ncbi:restriction endonuclease subunit S [Streptococcus thermophilus]|uniref:restriction endonuclease subunit S n=1 Tax=Streptococcus thermophilus TaxID=1308 RepID=UPI0015C286A6|nr:restriction endonuclease subunit S [Streptococcus thermophilus]MCT2981937.1 restriction endonuclease subunit S [Streptococcus thermophilus]CAD0176204.1 Type I restriction-modification system, specificity subunit S [Streptococcus thermophilus]
MSELSNVSCYVTEKISVDNIDISEYITTDNLLQNKRGRVLAEKLPTQKVTKFKKDDILIANIRPYLKKIWQADIEGGASSDVLVIRPNDLIDNNFLYYALTQDSFFEYVMKGSKGTKMPRGDKSQIMNFVIPDLDIDEQIKIGKLLKSIDQKIQINNQINQELEAMAKTLYDYWFVQFDFPDQNGKPYKSSGGKMVYHPELKREIPEGWGVEKLSHFLTIKNGKDHKHLQDGKFAVYGSGGIMRTVTDYLYSGESILFPRKGTLNNVMYVNEKFWTVDTMFYSEVNKNNSALYVFYSVKDIDFNKLNTGTGVPSMTSSILYDLSIIVPEDNILEKFNTVVKRNYETIKLNNIQNQELIQLRDWLLPMLMNGQVKVE